MFWGKYRQLIVRGVFFGGLFLLFYYFNSLTPLWADDYCRAVKVDSGIINVLSAVRDEYRWWSGRVVVNFLSYLFISYYSYFRILFSLVNSLMFVLLNALIYRFAVKGRLNLLFETGLRLVIFTFLFVGTQTIGEVALWKTGSIGYLWAVVLEMTVLLIAERVIQSDNNIKYRWWQLLLMGVITFIAATFLEHLSVAVGVYLIFRYAALGNIQPMRRYLRLIIGCHLTGMLLFLGPGNWQRLSIEAQHYDAVRVGLVNSLVWLLTTRLTIFFIIVALIMLFIPIYRKKIGWRIVGTVLAATIGMFVILWLTKQEWYGRRVFAWEVLLITGIIYFAGEVIKSRKGTLVISIIIISLAFYLTYHLSRAIPLMKSISKQSIQRLNLINQASVSGKGQVVFPLITLPYYPEIVNIDKYIYINEMTEDRNNWNNRCFASYYNLGYVYTDGKWVVATLK